MACRKGRLLASVVAVLLGIGVLVAAQTIGDALYNRTKEQLLRFGANVIIQPAESDLDIVGNDLSGTGVIPENYAERAKRIEHGKMLEAVSPKLYERFQVNGVTVTAAGITPEESKAKPWWMIDHQLLGDKFPQGDQVLLGHYASQRLGRPERIGLNGRSLRVAGVLDKTGSTDDFMAFLPLAALQELTGKPGMVNRIEVSTSCIDCKAMNVNDVAKSIDKQIPDDASVTTVRQIAEAQMGTLGKVQSFLKVASIVILLLSAFLLMNHMSASVSDRRREIGMLLAIGMGTRTIHTTFVLKALLIGLIGGLAGFLAGTALSVVLGSRIAEASVPARLDLLAYSVPISMALCALSSLLPARNATRVDPVEALREL